MYSDRVTLAAQDMDRVQEEELPFDLCMWVQWASDPLNCSTAACGMGWIARSEWAQRLGLRIVCGEPVLGRRTGISAAVDLFSIRLATAQWLFYDDSYLMPVECEERVFCRRDVQAWEVAARLRRLLAEGEDCVPSRGYPETALCDREDLLRRWSVSL